MRVVLDTNMLVRAAYSLAGPAAELLDELSRPEHTIVVFEFLLNELSRVLRYPRVRSLHGFSDAEIDRNVASLAASSFTVALDPLAIDKVVGPDPDDDPVVATAVVGRADVICTRDKHLFQPRVLEYCGDRGIQMLRDVDLLALLRQVE